MATFGIEVLTGLSEVRFTGKDKLLRCVYWTLLQAGSSGSVSVPEYVESKGLLQAIPNGSTDWYSQVDISWDESTKTLSWDFTYDESNADYIVAMYLYD